MVRSIHPLSSGFRQLSRHWKSSITMNQPLPLPRLAKVLIVLLILSVCGEVVSMFSTALTFFLPRPSSIHDVFEALLLTFLMLNVAFSLCLIIVYFQRGIKGAQPFLLPGTKDMRVWLIAITMNLAVFFIFLNTNLSEKGFTNSLTFGTVSCAGIVFLLIGLALFFTSRGVKS